MTVIVSALIGALAVILYYQYRVRQQKKSLIVVFATELVLVFERCILYLEQANRNEISYSALFQATDSTAISTLASVTNNPDVVRAIVELKAIYFQIARHVERASEYTTRSEEIFVPLKTSRDLDLIRMEESKKKELQQKAHIAQSMALGFFKSGYHRILKCTQQVINEAQRISSRRIGNDLKNRFEVQKAKYEKQLVIYNRNILGNQLSKIKKQIAKDSIAFTKTED